MASESPAAATADAARNASEPTQASTASSSTELSTIPANDRAATATATAPAPALALSSSTTTTTAASTCASRLATSPVQGTTQTILAATASMLPRSTASVSNNGAASTVASSSSSATAKASNRASAGSPRRASSSLAQHSQPILSTVPAPIVHRFRQHQPASQPPFTTAPTALADIDASNPVPSIFGFYSHHANATTQQTNHQRRDFLTTWPSSQSSFPPSRPQRTLGRWQANRMPAHTSSSFVPQGGRAQPSAQARANPTHSPSINSSADRSLLSPSLPSPHPTFEETTTISFTWTISDLHLLREEVEYSPPPSEGGRSVSAGAGKSDVWTSHPTFGDGKWKLELVRTTRPLTVQPHPDLDSDDNTNPSASSLTLEPVAVQDGDGSASAQRDSITILSVYLTSLVLDYTHANVEIPTSIMVGLRPIRSAVGRRGAENGGWLWRRFYDYTFQKEADLFTCHHLPSVSEMLEDANIARDDAVALTIQLGLGPGHARGSPGQLDEISLTRMPIEIDGHHLVPRAVLNSLHGLLDDANTGDVRILVRERGVLMPATSDRAAMSDDGHVDATDPSDTHGRILPYPVGSSCPIASVYVPTDAQPSIENDPDRIFVRDRVLWAHSSVLKSRSDYFASMLASDFSEGISRSYGVEANGGLAARNVRTLRIPDADFVTTYWFLRYLYTEDIRFADKEDVRSAVLDEEWAKGSDLGHFATRSLSGDASMRAPASKLLVDWTPISQLEDQDDYDTEENDAANTSMSYSINLGQPCSSSIDHSPYSPRLTASNATTSGSLRQRTSASGFCAAISPSIHGRAGSRSSTLSPPASPSDATANPSSATGGASKHHTVDEGARVGASGPRRTLSNASTVARPLAGTHDPHDHPCSDPGPASALSIFKLAHRYHMQELSRLASLHMVATLTPQSAFPMLLATSMYTELHIRIKTYVYQHWHLVSHTQEFERCCDEVSVGMWGADAGKTMRAFVKSLVSPLRAAQS
ncbi:hypothetical protein NDA18_000205 [Ustilago nuda]|nr:hypothetical protein NDA18_000205 [Ustilago nuda]